MRRNTCLSVFGGLLATALLATTAQAIPLAVAVADSTTTNCLFSNTCSLPAHDWSAPITTTGGLLQSRQTNVGEAGTPGEGLHLHGYRVNLTNAVGILAIDCVRSIDLPFGEVVPFDYDEDGSLEDVWENSAGVGNVSIASAEQLDDTVRIHFAGAGVCQGAFAGDGDSSLFFRMASRHEDRGDDSVVDFNFAPGVEAVQARVPDVPETAAMEDYAFAWASQPSTPVYNPLSTYTHNRAGGGTQITRSGVGRYRVTFEGMDTLWNVHGNAQVSTYGTSYIDDVHCNTPDWGADYVDVQCFDDVGAFVDATFNVLLAKPMPIRDGVAYVRARQPTSASYQPGPDDVFNPGGAGTTITRTSQGVYEVNFPGFATPLIDAPALGGNVQVTSMGTASVHCTIDFWQHWLGNVFVRCHDRTGALQDAEWSLLWLMPNERFDKDLAYAWSDTLATSFYEPPLRWASNPADDGVFGTWSSTGRYVIEFQDLSTIPGALSSHVQVTPYGFAGNRCGVRNWGAETIFVDCFDAGGTTAESQFSLLRLEPTFVPEPGGLVGILVGTVGTAVAFRRRAPRA